MKLHPFIDVCEALLKRRLDGWEYCLQFNCEHCGKKQTIETPNTIFEIGQCEECGKLTDIKKNGCNYMLYGGRGMKLDDLLQVLKTKAK